MRLITRTRIACLIVGLSPLAAVAEEVSLAADLEHGDTMRYVYRNELSQRPTGGLGQDFFLTYTLGFEAEVVQVSEMYTDLQLVFDRIEIDSTMGAFDSDDPEEEDVNNLVATALRPVIGRVFTVRLDDGMGIVGITAPPANHVPDMVYGLYARIFDEKTLSESIQPIFRLKDDPSTASVGESWEQMIDRRANVGRIEIRLRHALERVKEGVATVKTDGEHVIRDVQTTPVSQRIVEQTIDGEALWSVEDGALKSLELEKSFTMEAGDERFDLGVKVVEKERMTREE